MRSSDGSAALFNSMSSTVGVDFRSRVDDVLRRAMLSPRRSPPERRALSAGETCRRPACMHRSSLVDFGSRIDVCQGLGPVFWAVSAFCLGETRALPDQPRLCGLTIGSNSLKCPIRFKGMAMRLEVLSSIRMRTTRARAVVRVLRDWSLRHARGWPGSMPGAARLAPWLAPLARRVGVPRFGRWLAPVEHVAKGLFFDCQMCGDCALGHRPGLPHGCGKQMRNGPCGGVRANGHCELRPGSSCTWLEAGGRPAHAGRRSGEHRPSWRERVAPLDRRRAGQSSWIRVISADQADAPPVWIAQVAAPTESLDPMDPVRPSGPFEQACRNGTAVAASSSRWRSLHPIHLTRPRCCSGLTASPAGWTPSISPMARAPTATCPASRRPRCWRPPAHPGVPWAAATATASRCRATCWALRPWAMRNVLCLTGDDVSQGRPPEAKPVFDLDAVNLLHILRGMSDAVNTPRAASWSRRRDSSWAPPPTLRSALRRPGGQPGTQDRRRRALHPDPVLLRPGADRGFHARCVRVACTSAPPSSSRGHPGQRQGPALDGGARARRACAAGRHRAHRRCGRPEGRGPTRRHRNHPRPAAHRRRGRRAP